MKKIDVWKKWDKSHILPDEINKKLGSFIVKTINRNIPSTCKINFLDCGIGTGVISIPLYKEIKKTYDKIEILGFDKDESKFPLLNDRTKKNNLHKNIKTILCDAEDKTALSRLLKSKKNFNVIMIIWFLHYLQDPYKFLNILKENVNENTTFCVGTSANDLLFLTFENQNYKIYANNDNIKLRLFKEIHNNFLEIYDVPDYHNAINECGLRMINRSLFKWNFKLKIIELLNIYKYRLISRKKLSRYKDKQLSDKILNIKKKFNNYMNYELNLLMGLRIYVYKK